ncbi:hypothetical protein C6497_14875 [Candidatus Poribacteria bacterium]|nr:MAG: hypothetical protein C6497_14875 [Candidatus Poribacteria bacterium]
MKYIVNRFRKDLSVLTIAFLILAGISINKTVFPQNPSNIDQTARIKALNAIQDANNLYYDRSYKEAINAYKKLLKTDLTQTQKDSMRLMLGQSHAKLGEDADARSIFMELINENPNGSYATQAVHQLTSLFSQRYQYNEALLQCQQILKQHPNTSAGSIAAYLSAYYFYVEGKIDKAMEGYKFFLDTYPESIYRSSAVSNLVRLYTENERFDEAEKLIKKRIELNPTDTTLIEELASIYRQQEFHQKALDLYISILDKNPTNTTIRRKLGTLYLELGDKKQAIIEWEKIVAGQFDKDQQMGSIFLANKLYDEAIDAYRKAIASNRSYGYLYTQLASAYKIQTKIDEAADIYIDGLKNVGTSVSSRETIWRAMVDIYVGERQKPLQNKLIAKLQAAYNKNPNNIISALTLGELLFYAEQLEASLEIFVKLYPIYSTSIDSTIIRFATILERNHNPYAIEFYKTLLKHSRDMRQITSSRLKLAKLYQKEKLWNEAADLLQKLQKNNSFTIDSQILLSYIQLHGQNNPKAAQKTVLPLLKQQLEAEKFVEIQLILSECYILQKQYELARQVLIPIANNISKSKAHARKLIADSYFFGNNYDTAIKEYKKLVQISRYDHLTNDALDKIVLIQDNKDFLTLPLTEYANTLQLYLSGNIDAAITQCEDTITLHPKSLIVDDLWMLLGTIHRSQKSYGDALHSYRQVVSQKTSLAVEALAEIASIYEEREDLTNAAETYTTLLTTYPDNSIIPHVRQQLDTLTKRINNQESGTP